MIRLQPWGVASKAVTFSMGVGLFFFVAKSGHTEGGHPGAPGGVDRRIVTKTGHTSVSGDIDLTATLPPGVRLRNTDGAGPTFYLGGRVDAPHVEVDAGVASDLKAAAQPSGYAWDAFIRVTGGVSGNGYCYANVWNPTTAQSERWYLTDGLNNSSISTHIEFDIHADGTVSLMASVIANGSNNTSNKSTTFYWNTDETSGVSNVATLGPTSGSQVFTALSLAQSQIRVKRNRYSVE